MLLAMPGSLNPGRRARPPRQNPDLNCMYQLRRQVCALDRAPALSSPRAVSTTSPHTHTQIQHPDPCGHDTQSVFLGFHHAGCWQPSALTDSMFGFAPLIRPRNARSPSPSRAPPPTVRTSTHALEAPAEPQQTRAFNGVHALHLPRDMSGALQRGRSAHPACAPTSKSAQESSRFWQPEPKRLRCALALLRMARTRSVAVRPTAFGGLLWCCSLRKCGCCSLRKCAGGKTRPREATSCDSARHIQCVQLRAARIARTTALRAAVS
ncbi:hypothetical protein B0H17DRAFT_1219286 [Mycena rosella]|uniref:Uncharacterized protein n=1 Tax=Mycena rosella TaxID=1033263 RepID=A0AAD7BI14_MYCRO|nr:hypothetical protein B0H17DRAFT_1219286 [Mycena rosella]